MALHVALIEPQIPPNTGNIARTCAATESSLHLIEPLGFSLHDPELIRSSVHFWDEVDLWVHKGWPYFRQAMDRSRCYYFSARATTSFWDAEIPDGSCLVFGNESLGMPQRILDKHPERCFQIPMTGVVRNLNLATSVGIVLYETLRKLGFEGEVPTHDAPRTTYEEFS